MYYQIVNCPNSPCKPWQCEYCLTEGKQWNESRVKDVLPRIKLRVGKILYWAKVSGRLNEFASVSAESIIDNRKRHYQQVMGAIYHYSWATIANALNNGKALIV